MSHQVVGSCPDCHPSCRRDRCRLRLGWRRCTGWARRRSFFASCRGWSDRILILCMGRRRLRPWRRATWPVSRLFCDHISAPLRRVLGILRNKVSDRQVLVKRNRSFHGLNIPGPSFLLARALRRILAQLRLQVRRPWRWIQTATPDFISQIL